MGRMDTKIGIAFDGFDRANDSLKLARLAEKAGIKSIWVAEHMGYREAVTLCAAIAVGTTSVTLIPTAISPYLWHPTPTAMAMSTLWELAPSRAACCVSVGNLLNLSESGRTPEKPVLALQEFIEDLRALWSGKTVSAERINYTLNGARMDFATGISIPVYVASTGPKVLQMSGRVANGSLFSVGLSLDYTRQCVDWVNAGLNETSRNRSDFSMASFLFFGVSENGKDAVNDLRRKLAFLFRSVRHSENIVSSGLPIDHEAIIDAAGRRDFDTATSLIPDDAVDAFCIGGTPSNSCDRLEEYINAGIDEPVLQIVGSPANQQLAIETIRDYIG